ncbi:PTS sugar transporter subunit IIA [Rhizocola hellebori]|uniref:PTS sugar transporter subunit IIA n=1 Tax=Rhizocola hellebori TaxID=1392758 RepID=A0A8J3VMH0_9ACTN|nr:PTS transporter subunit EIIC [Rhizocola hellebori]GIH11667.1 PTS sugar transporter subunit IIA [Rhizocola hellebori]
MTTLVAAPEPRVRRGSAVFGVLQRIGRSLMMPIAVLPIAGLFQRFGQADIANRLGVSANNAVSQVLLQAGNAIFDHLPLLFAVGVAIGFARKSDGSTALAAVVGFLVFDAVYTVVAGYDKVNGAIVSMGVLGGILMGITTALLYERFHRTKLPSYLGFFGGRRLVPILAGCAALVNGVLFGLIWPFLGRGFNAMGNWIVANDTLGAGVYGVVNRLLVPTGLHHIPNSLVWFTFGEYDGKTGDLNRFFAGDPTAGGFMTGFFPIMMFALPAACLAMIHTARPERRKAIAGLLGSAALTSFLTGITEPIEFAFVFVAPLLYVVHAILTGLSMVIMNALGARDGFTFSAGFIDWGLNFFGANHEKPWLVFLVGAVYGVLYYTIFRFMILRFDLKTPGREPEEESPEVLGDHAGERT